MRWVHRYPLFNMAGDTCRWTADYGRSGALKTDKQYGTNLSSAQMKKSWIAAVLIGAGVNHVCVGSRVDSGRTAREVVQNVEPEKQLLRE